MARFETQNDKATPVLSEVVQPALALSVEDLFNPEHPVNIKGASGKRAGLGVMIDSHIWVAEGSEPTASWHRMQKHIEQGTTILRDISNTTGTVSTGDSTYSDSFLGELIPVETFFEGGWVVTPDMGIITYTGEEAVFRFEVNGDVRTTDSSGTGDNIRIHLYDDQAMDGLTGASKVLPVTKVQGGTVTLVDFTLIGYARVNTGDVFRLQVGSNFAGSLVVGNILWTILPLDALMYQ